MQNDKKNTINYVTIKSKTQRTIKKKLQLFTANNIKKVTPNEILKIKFWGSNN